MKRICSIYVVKTKALISWAVTMHLICAFVFAYTKIRFSNEAAHTLYSEMKDLTQFVISFHFEVYIQSKGKPIAVTDLVENVLFLMRKPDFCICQNKDADQLRSNCAADQRLCFRYTNSTIPLLAKSEISSL